MSDRARLLQGLSREEKARLLARLREEKARGTPSASPTEPPAGPRVGTEAGSAAAPIRPRDPASPRDRAPLSAAQERLWFLHRLDPASPAYNVPEALALRGPLDAPALARALAGVIARHEPLSARYAFQGGEPVQYLAPPAPGARLLPLVDLGALPAAAARGELARLARREAARPFDLAGGPPLRATLVRLGEEEHGLLLDVHHIAFDGWSRGIFFSELAHLYRAFTRPAGAAGEGGGEDLLPPLPITYGDFAAWQRQWLRGPEAAAELAWWRRQLASPPPPLALPADRPRPVRPSFRGGSLEARWPAALRDRLAALARARRGTLFTVLLAGFGALLGRLSGQREVAVGTPVAGRNRPEVRGLVGFFVNTLVLRLPVDEGESFDALLPRAREVATGAFEHQDLPFDRLVEALRPERAPGENPFFRAMLVLQNAPAPSLDAAGLRFETLPAAAEIAKFDLTLVVSEEAAGLGVTCEHSAELFDRGTVAELLAALEALLAAAADRPERPVGELLDELPGPLLARARGRRGLAAPEPAPAEPAPADPALADPPPTRPPVGEIEGRLAPLFMEALAAAGAPAAGPIGAGDDFFRRGGSSLAALRLVARIGEEFGDEIPLRAFFEAPTVAAVAALLAGGDERDSAGAGPAALPPIRPRERPAGAAPLSFPASAAQQRLGFLERLDPASGRYNIPLGLELDGAFRPSLLARALTAVVARHEGLRTRLVETGEELRQEVDPPAPVPIPRVDLQALEPARAREAAGRELARREAHHPFDLARQHPVRALLLVTGEEAHRLLLTLHHSAADGASVALLRGELLALYGGLASGTEPELPELPVQMGEVASWQREQLAGPRYEALLAWWRTALAGLPPAVDLPYDRTPSGAVGEGAADGRGGTVSRPLPAPAAVALGALAREAGATPFMAFAALAGLLLARRTRGGDGAGAGSGSGSGADLAFGTPVSGRGRPELAPLIGCLVNLLVLRLTPRPGMSFRDLLAHVRQAALGAWAHAELPFERLVAELAREGDLGGERGRGPLFQISFAVEEGRPFAAELPGLAVRAASPPLERVKFDLQLTVVLPSPLETAGTAAEGGPRVHLDFAAELFDRTTAGRLLGAFGALLEEAVARPDAPLKTLRHLPLAELHQVLREHARGRVSPSRPAPWPLGRILDRAATGGDAVAVVRHLDPAASGPAGGGGAAPEHWSYGALLARARGLARRLSRLGAVAGESPVALLTGRTPELVVGALGAMLAGAPYLPLDPATPERRLAFFLADSGARALLTTGELAAARGGQLGELLPPGVPLLRVDDPAAEAASEAGPGPLPEPVAPHPETLAYLIYTSGSTGVPKGVGIPHRGLANLVAWHLRAYPMPAGERVGSAVSPAFDAAVWDLWPHLAVGATLHLAPEEARLSASRLVGWLGRAAIDRLFLPTALGELLLAAVGERSPAPGPLPRTVLVGGDRLRLLPGPGLPFRMIDHYGPTETSVVATWGGPPFLGRPVDGLTNHLVDARLKPVPLGVPGQLGIGGAGVGRGYLGRPAATAARFVPDPWSDEPGGRLYLTGDLARFRAGGEVDFLGRADHQVQLRGLRVELGEIEAALLAWPRVGEAAVVLTAGGGEAGGAGARLDAFLTLAPEPGSSPALDPAALRAHLAESLPAYMVPATFTVLAAMPRTASGKIDRQALPRPEGGAAPGVAPGPPAGPVSGARADLERRIARIWSEVLGRERVGRAESFFDLGGSSLTLARVHGRLEEELGRELPLIELFQYPTVAALAAFLAPEAPALAPAVAPALTPAAVPAAGARSGAGETGIAIIGMVCRVPGAPDVETFWANLLAGVEAIGPASSRPPVGGEEGESWVPRAAVLAGADLFDAPFFGFSPREAEVTDPQHRIFLEAAWEALETAGHTPEGFPGRIGVYAGASLTDHPLRLHAHPEVVRAAGALAARVGVDKDFLATRVSYKLDLDGPSLSVQTACSTSLVAVHLAVQALLAGECDMALAGGISVRNPEGEGYFHESGGVLSPDGHCRAFDAEAAGTVSGDGVGIVVLRRLADAVADGDAIAAVIRGTAINNDGAGKVGYTAPGLAGQVRVIRDAQAAAGVAPREIGYIEAHGTGTPLGDPIEIRALAEAFAAGGGTPGPVWIGAVKTGIGHLDAAAGVVGLIKTALATGRGTLPPSLHFHRPSPRIPFAELPFEVVTEAQAWPAGEGPRRAGVSSFGIGGTNAHAVLEEPPALPPGGPTCRGVQLLPLSARTPEALERAGEGLADHLSRISGSRTSGSRTSGSRTSGARTSGARGSGPSGAGTALADVAFTLWRGRRAFPHRRVVLAATPDEAVAALRGEAPERLLTGQAGEGAPPVAFLFPGQGAQEVGMGAGAYGEEPVFREAFDRCAEGLRPHLASLVPDGDLRHLLAPPAARRAGAAEALRQTALTQPALFAVEFALAALWRSWGVEPAALAGHSIGELVAATLAGVFSLEDALAVVAARGRLIGGLPPGAMLAVPLGAAELTALLREAGVGEEISLAAVNGPASSVASGPPAAIAALAEELRRRGVRSRPLATSHAFHSAMMEPILAPFAEVLAGVELAPPRLPLLSNVTGTWMRPEEATDPRYWVRHLRQPVLFSDLLGELAGGDPATLLLEVGPGRTLGSLARRHPAWKGRAARILAPGAGGASGSEDGAAEGAGGLRGGLARLWLAGVQVDGRGLFAGEDRRRLALPTYPFERRSYRLDAPGVPAAPAKALEAATGPAPGPAPRLEGPKPLADWFYLPSWRRTLLPAAVDLPSRLGGEEGAWVLFAGPSGPPAELAAALRAALAPAPGPVVTVAPAPTGAAGVESPAPDHRLPPADPAAWRELLAGLARQGSPARRLLVLGPLGEGERGLAETFDSLLALSRAICELAGERAGEPGEAAPPELWVVADRLFDVAGGEAIDPFRATLIGPCQVLPHELPGARAWLLDPGPVGRGEEGAATIARRLLEEILRRPEESLLAFRGDQRWVPHLEPVSLPPAAPEGAPLPLRRHGVYLVTGGLGGVGLALARELAAACAARLVLLGRRALPPREEWDESLEPGLRRRLLELEELGAEVLTVAADVGDREAVARAVAAAEARFGPLRGVIHAAGVPGGGILRLKEPAAAAAVLRPKVAGSLVLDEVLGSRELDFFLLCSSLNALLPVFGQADYMAANAFEDAFAAWRSRRRPGRTVSVGWDRWAESGMAVEAARREEARRAGLRREGAGREGAGSTAPHPLLGERIEVGAAGAGAGAVIYRARLSPAEHWVLAEHRLGPTPILPGTAYAEMARAALAEELARAPRESAGDGGGIEIRELTFLTPLFLPAGGAGGEGREEESVEVCTILRPSPPRAGEGDDGSREVLVASRRQGRWQRHATGRVAPRSMAPRQAPLPDIELTDVPEEAAEVAPGSVTPGSVTPGSVALDFGPRWQSLRRIGHRGRDLVARLELPAAFAGDLDAFPLHPALLDVAAGFGLAVLTAGAPGPTPVPFAWRGVRVHAPLTPALRSHARLLTEVGEGGEGPDHLAFALTLTDPDGRVLVEVEEFTLRRMAGGGGLSAGELLPDAGRPDGELDALLGPPEPGMSDREGAEVFRRILAASPVPHLLVSTTDLPRRLAHHRGLAGAELLAEVAAMAPARTSRHPRPTLATPYAAPAAGVEEALAELWGELLGLERVGAHDDFFELGGDSVLALRILARAGEKGFRISPNQIFENPTVARLAASLGADAPASAAPEDAAAGGGAPGDAAPGGGAPGAGEEAGTPALLPPPSFPAGEPWEDVYPLSPVQQGMLFHTLLAPEEGFYQDQVRMDLAGEVDLGAFRRAWSEVLGRHPVLRTSFHWEGEAEPLQVVHPGDRLRLPLAVVDLRSVGAAGEAEALLEELAARERRRPFDLGRAPLSRWTLFLLPPSGPGRAQLAWSYHHILTDAWSGSVLFGEVFTLYARALGLPAAPLPPPVPYRRYIDWLGGQDPDAARAFWRRELAGFTRPTPLPWGEGGAEERGQGEVALDLPAAETRSLAALARVLRITPNTLVQGAWALLLSRAAGEGEVVFGATVSGRPPEVAGVESIVGLLINTLPVRIAVPADAELGTWLREIQRRQGRARRFEASSLAEIQSVCELEPGEPLFSTLLAFENIPGAELAATGRGAGEAPLTVAATRYLFRAHYPLAVQILPGEESWHFRLAFDRRALAATTVRRLGRQLLALLGRMGEGAGDRRLGELSRLDPAEAHALAVEWGGGPAPYPREATLPELVARQAAARPDAVAVVAAPDTALTYGELWRRSGLLARCLGRLGVGPEVPVGVALGRSVELPVALLGILRAGGAYVPLDPAYPEERLTFMAEDAGISLLLTAAGGAMLPEIPGLTAVDLRAALAAEAAIGGPEPPPSPPGLGPESLAYLVYTSGSTGRPKGVAAVHRGVLRLVLGTDYVRFGPEEVLYQSAPVAFDASTFEIWGALLHGARLVLAPPHPQALTEITATLREQGVTTFWVTTGLFHQLAEHCPDELGRLSQILTGGEAAVPALFQRVLDRASPDLLLYNAYGPTENTTYSSGHRLHGGEDLAGVVTLGRPIANTTARITDARLHPLPIGAPGELLLGGDGLARGYLQRPAATAAAFVPDPAAGAGPGSRPGSRLYRSGDRCRMRPDGLLDFLGRIDTQVKLRGFRIEPGEIESALLAHGGVREAVVLVREDRPGDRRLVAYVVPAPGVTDAELGGWLAARLPSFMVPTAFVELAELPLGPHGKVDRRALPTPRADALPAAAGAPSPGASRPPRGPIEPVLAELFADVLDRAEVEVDDDFFALGGHSLLATRLVARLRSRLGVAVPLRALFEHPTVASLAARIAAGGAGETPGALPGTLPGTLPGLLADTLPELAPVTAEGELLPLSHAQERLWFLDRLEPGLTAYNVPFALELRGEAPRPAVLRAALGEILRRHGALRTRFVAVDGEGFQIVEAPRPLPLPAVDLRRLDPAAADRLAHRLAAREAERPFDLGASPLLRSTLLALPRDGAGTAVETGAEERHVLLLTLHHIVSDGWSMGVLLNEAAALYEAFAAGRPSPLPELPVQYGDFALWQRRALGLGDGGDGLGARQLAWWRGQLAGAPPALDLPLDRPRPPVQTFRGGRVRAHLPADLAAALEGLGHGAGATPFMVLLAAFGALLERHTGDRDLPLGSPVANRTRPEIEGLIGFFVNLLVLRVEVCPEASFRHLLARVRETALGAYAHQDLPFEALVAELAPRRDLAVPPLFQILFVLQTTALPVRRLPGLTLKTLPVAPELAKYDLQLTLQGDDDGDGTDGEGAGLDAWLEYNADLFDAATARRLLERYVRLLGAIAAAPERPLASLPLLAPAEVHQLVREYNDGPDPGAEAAGGGAGNLAELVFARAALCPEAVALVAAGERLSYGELARRARELAAELAARGAGPEVRVGVALERGPELVTAILATLAAGAAYVPLDPAWPEARVAFMLADSGAALLLTRSHLAPRFTAAPGAPGPAVLCLDRRREDLPAGPPGAPLPAAASGNLAYIIYTSGSTGRPKGVAIEHRSALALIAWARETFPEPWLAGTLAATSVCFDLSIFELFVPLAAGARVILVDTALHLLTLPEAGEVTLVNTVPSAMAELLAARGLPPSVRAVHLAGEPLTGKLAAAVYRDSRAEAVWNLYGPSEDTTYSTAARVPREGDRPPTIGRPIAGTAVRLLDGGGRPVPPGAVGEIHLAGAGLARGYLGRPALTAAAFVPDPEAGAGGGPGGRLYKTGDLARYRADGELEFLGRRDRQVKTRGFRIELGEVEAALIAHPAVREAAVIARQDPEGGGDLVAYVVQDHDLSGLRDFLRERLPAYMVPGLFIPLAELPLTPSGKIDRRALPAPGADRPRIDSDYVAPGTDTERKLAALWEEILRLPRVGVRDHFFELGGHSLLLVRAHARLKALFGVDLPIVELFQHPTIESLARRLDAAAPGPEGPGAAVGTATAAERAALKKAGQLRAGARRRRPTPVES